MPVWPAPRPGTRAARRIPPRGRPPPCGSARGRNAGAARPCHHRGFRARTIRRRRRVPGCGPAGRDQAVRRQAPRWPAPCVGAAQRKRTPPRSGSSPFPQNPAWRKGWQALAAVASAQGTAGSPPVCELGLRAARGPPARLAASKCPRGVPDHVTQVIPYRKAGWKPARRPQTKLTTCIASPALSTGGGERLPCRSPLPPIDNAGMHYQRCPVVSASLCSAISQLRRVLRRFL